MIHRLMYNAVTIFLLLMIGCAHQHTLQQHSTLGIHTPVEILKIMDESTLVYTLDIDSTITATPDTFASRLFPNFYQVHVNDSTIVVQQYEIPDEATPTIQKAERFFQRGQLVDAIATYRVALQQVPTYYHLWTLIGDAFYNMQAYDSARVYLKRAIQYNFIDYAAHWYLADTYWALGQKTQALEELTLAHVLNRTHPQLLARLQARRASDHPWKSWDFRPRYRLSKTGHRVQVRFSEPWLGYAMVKAVWAYEPGYAAAMSPGASPGSLVNFKEETEAMATEVLPLDTFPELKQAIEAGYIAEAIWYEQILPQYPQSILSLSPAMIQRIATYVDLAH